MAFNSQMKSKGDLSTVGREFIFALRLLRCPGLVPDGYKNLLHYSQSTCSSSNLKEEEHDFRAGGIY